MPTHTKNATLFRKARTHLLDPLLGFCVILGKLFDEVGADVAVELLDLLGGLERLLRGNVGLTVSQQLLHEVCDVTPSNGDVLDATPDHVPFGLHDGAYV